MPEQNRAGRVSSRGWMAGAALLFLAGDVTAVICPRCGATTIPDAQGKCEYCGGAVND